MKIFTLITGLFFLCTSITVMADDNLSYSNVSTRALMRKNVASCQLPSAESNEIEDYQSYLSYINMQNGYYYWIGRYITFKAYVKGRKKNGRVLLSKNCNMKRRTIVHLFTEKWRPGQYKSFSPTNNPRKKLLCKVLKIIIL